MQVTDLHSQNAHKASKDPQCAASFGQRRASRGSLRHGTHRGERTTGMGGQLRGAGPFLSPSSLPSALEEPEPRKGWRREAGKQNKIPTIWT